MLSEKSLTGKGTAKCCGEKSVTSNPGMSTLDVVKAVELSNVMSADTCPAKLSDEVPTSETVVSYEVSAIAEENVTTGGVGSGANEASTVYCKLAFASNTGSFDPPTL